MSLLLSETFIKFHEEQTDLFLELNDKHGIDARILRGTYKVYIRGVAISCTLYQNIPTYVFL